MTTCYGVLLDTVSIQRYIFQSNELKENIGASYIIEKLVYRDYLKEALEEVFPYAQINLDEWKREPFLVQGCDPFEIAYIGGGNALLLFGEEEDAKFFIRIWTLILMVKSPQVNTAIALDAFNLNRFQESKKFLFNKLRNNKLRYSPQTILPAHGITAECTRSGLSLNKWNENIEDFVSAVSYAKINAAKTARDKLNEAYKEILEDQFTFTNKQDKLGQIEDEGSHIAIVHIDGNDVGQYFFNSEIDTLHEMRKNSVMIDQITSSTFKSLLRHIVENCPQSMFPIDDEDEKKRRVVPIRPIINSGDDITFVCDGKMGIYFAEKYIHFFKEEAEKQDIPISVCAGIAIIKTKYPFFKGYRLAEELCRHAKTIRKKEEEACSYLDFHISSGAIVGSLADMRRIHFKGPLGRLHCRPYRIDKNREDEKSFSLLLKNSKQLENNFPNNKLHKLREVLTMNQTARDGFFAEIKARQRKLPVIPGMQFENKLFESIMEAGEEILATPYLDMIEMIKFYPLSLEES